MVVESLAARIEWGFAGPVGNPARELARLAREQRVSAVIVGAWAPTA